MTDATLRNDDKVADALKHSWVYYLPRSLWPYAQLARWERPIGWQLLMWPCFWSLALALLEATDEGSVSLSRTLFLFALFVSGAFLMRGAGCTYNDLVDIDIDSQVERTRSRPLPAGRATKKSAFAFLLAQGLGGFLVLLGVSYGSLFTFMLGVASLVTVAIYPFMKRVTWWPQLFLGLAFSWGALMGWSSIHAEISLASLLLYVSCILWVIGYDTIYAHQDREDDALVGVKSTARLFGEKSKRAIGTLYALALTGFAIVYWLVLPLNEIWAMPAWFGLALGALQLGSQIKRLDIEDGDQCLKLFKSNSKFGMTLFVGLSASLLTHSLV
jgi:4-hydroxybenzoate polyprenyltransferase